MSADDDTTRVPTLNAETLLGDRALSEALPLAAREAAGYIPRQVTLRVQGDIKLAELEYALAGKFEIYVDCTEALCLRTVEAGKAHRDQVRAERAARAEHARRHAALVKMEGDRNVAHGYQKCQDETATIVNGKWVCSCPKVPQP